MVYTILQGKNWAWRTNKCLLGMFASEKQELSCEQLSSHLTLSLDACAMANGLCDILWTDHQILDALYKE